MVRSFKSFPREYNILYFMFENSLIVFIVFYFEKTKNEKTKMTHCFKIRLEINAAQKLRFNCGDTISVFFL